MRAPPLSAVASTGVGALEATGTIVCVAGDRGRQEWFPSK